MIKVQQFLRCSDSENIRFKPAYTIAIENGEFEILLDDGGKLNEHNALQWSKGFGRVPREDDGKLVFLHEDPEGWAWGAAQKSGTYYYMQEVQE